MKRTGDTCYGSNCTVQCVYLIRSSWAISQCYIQNRILFTIFEKPMNIHFTLAVFGCCCRCFKVQFRVQLFIFAAYFSFRKCWRLCRCFFQIGEISMKDKKNMLYFWIFVHCLCVCVCFFSSVHFSLIVLVVCFVGLIEIKIEGVYFFILCVWLQIFSFDMVHCFSIQKKTNSYFLSACFPPINHFSFVFFARA